MEELCIDNYIKNSNEIFIFFKNFGEKKKNKIMLNFAKFAELNNILDRDDYTLAGFIEIDKVYAKFRNCTDYLLFLKLVCNDESFLKKLAKLSKKYEEIMTNKIYEKFRHVMDGHCSTHDHYLIKIICSKLQKNNKYKEESQFRNNIVAHKQYLQYKNNKYDLFNSYQFLDLIRKIEKETRRKEIYYIKYKGIAKNRELIEAIQNHRHADAIKNGYKNYATFAMRNSRYTNPEELIGKLQKLKNEYYDKCELLIEDIKNLIGCDLFLPWNFHYCVAEYEKQLTLPYTKLKIPESITAIMSYFAAHYNYKILENKSYKIWHKDVLSYDVFENNKKIGIIMLDLFHRNGKYTHAMTQPLKTMSIHDDSVSEVGVIMNILNRDYFTHRESIVFVHELGHAFYHIVCSVQNNYYFANGLNGLKRDEIEISAVYFESFAFSEEFLNFVTKENIKISTEEQKINKMLQKLKMLLHIEMAIADLRLHSATKKLTYEEINKYYVDEVKNYDKNYHLLTFLYHYENYPANYYAYIVSLLS